MPILLLSFFIIILDQWTKYYVEHHMSLGMSIPVINDIFHITYILNPGAAFGILENQASLLVCIALIMIAILIYFYSRIPATLKLLRFGLGLLAGGSIGNVIDRVRTGYVVDFFDFRIWPVFNIADIAIVCGVFSVIWTIAFVNKEVEDND
ncbi:Lipoprotein signal peptidase [bioreactor metagenome]|uniref:Lipoprotein signal peptidase n=1 Tax=bioreactor metagenome TaxID=1076179 RepID=A0A644T3H7_9ZZZZ|nr:signal peptidase II [Negativicutes bacterium]